MLVRILKVGREELLRIDPSMEQVGRTCSKGSGGQAVDEEEEESQHRRPLKVRLSSLPLSLRRRLE